MPYVLHLYLKLYFYYETGSHLNSTVIELNLMDQEYPGNHALYGEDSCSGFLLLNAKLYSFFFIYIPD